MEEFGGSGEAGDSRHRKTAFRQFLKELPLVGGLLRGLHWSLRAGERAKNPFPGTGAYWEGRYRGGGDSGAGSYGRAALHKARVLNEFVAARGVRSVIEFGCGDGSQLRFARYPRYLGFDISAAAVQRCRARYEQDTSRSFSTLDSYRGERADLALSLDVLYHLVEEETFRSYLERLFGAAGRYVIIYSSNTDRNFGFRGTHVRHRRFTDRVPALAPGWRLTGRKPGWSFFRGLVRYRYAVDFYFYERTGSAV